MDHEGTRALPEYRHAIAAMVKENETYLWPTAVPAAPALHLRKLSAGDLFDTYAESFETVWGLSKPANF